MSTVLPPITTRAPSSDGSVYGGTRVIIKEVEGRAKTVIIIGEEAEGESATSSVFTLCNSAIGAGVLSLPYAFACAGMQPTKPAGANLYAESRIAAVSAKLVLQTCTTFIYCNQAGLQVCFRAVWCLAVAGIAGCILLCIVLGAVEGFTLYVLSKFAERYSAHTYSRLVRKALGRKLSASESASTCCKPCHSGRTFVL